MVWNHQLANLWFCRFYSLKVPFHHPTSPPPQKRTTTIADLVVNFPRKRYNCSEFHVGSVHISFFKKTQMSPFTTTGTTTGWGGATALFGLLTWDDVWTLGSSRFATVSHTGFGKRRVFIRDESLMFMFWKKHGRFLGFVSFGDVGLRGEKLLWKEHLLGRFLLRHQPLPSIPLPRANFSTSQKGWEADLFLGLC